MKILFLNLSYKDLPLKFKLKHQCVNIGVGNYVLLILSLGYYLLYGKLVTGCSNKLKHFTLNNKRRFAHCHLNCEF
jgi:hypothetical protein